MPILTATLLAMAQAAPTSTRCDALREDVNPNANHPDKIASYVIHAKFDAQTHRVTGYEVIDWKNPSHLPTDAIYLHAYLNAFKSEKSRFMRETQAHRRSRANLTVPGELVIKSVIAEQMGQAELWPKSAPHTEGDPLDETSLRLPLPRPVDGHAKLTLRIEFEALLPELVERSGYVDSFHAVTQWFPKIARRTADGKFRHFPYAPLAEFSADFGDYEVTIDAPADFVIAAPGTRVSSRLAGRRRIETYRLEDAHDFAWFAWDRFVVHEERIEHLTVKHFSYDDQRWNRERTLETLRWALPELNRSLSPLPYANLVIVHPPDRASASGGMEYPGLIVTGGPWYLAMTRFRFMESLTVHELVHQWFYGLLATDEYLHPVLDEGLTSYVEASLLNKHFRLGSAYSGLLFQVSEATLRESQARLYTRRGPLDAPATAFGDFAELQGRIYARTATLLDSMGRVFDATKLNQALARFARQYRFLHPEPEDFLQLLACELGDRQGALLRTAFFGSGWVDNAVTSLKRDADGITRIGVERRGTLDFPVELEAKLASGQVLRRTLDSLPEKGSVTWQTSSPIVAVTLDPEFKVTLDDDLGNQTRYVDGAARRPTWLDALVHGLSTALLGSILP